MYCYHGYHATNEVSGIRCDGVVKPMRMTCVYLFTDFDSAKWYCSEFGYSSVVKVAYMSCDIAGRWKHDTVVYSGFAFLKKENEMKTYCKVDDPPKYCHICGKALVMRARRKEFDIYAGNEIIEQRLECTVPNHDEWVKEDKFYHNIKRE